MRTGLSPSRPAGWLSPLTRTQLGPGPVAPSLLRRIAACIGLLLLLWGTGCAYRYARQQSAHREETHESTWETHAESAVEQRRSEETRSNVNRTIERFRPDGTLLERLTEQVASDGRVQVDTSASASASAAGADFASVVAASSSTSDVKAEAGTISLWWWLLMAVLLVAGVWPLRRRLRSFIPW